MPDTQQTEPALRSAVGPEHLAAHARTLVGSDVAPIRRWLADVLASLRSLGCQ